MATSPEFVPPEQAKEALSQYARQQQLKWLFSQLTAGQKGQALQQLLFDHFAGLPKRTAALDKLDFLATQFGTEFEVTRQGKVNTALRKATLVKVLERLALYLFAQPAASLTASDDDQAEVVAALEALEETAGPQVAISATKAKELRGHLSKLAKTADAETANVLKELEALLKGGVAV